MLNLDSPPARPLPSPPGRHQGNGGSMTIKGELKSEMDGENCVYEKSRTRPYRFRRCKKLRPTIIQSLPDDIMFKIFLNLPAQDIYNVAMLVRRKWYHMIHSHKFIHSHLEHSPTGLLIQNQAPAYITSPIFVAMRHGQIEISKFSYNFRDTVWTSCNGLILECDFRNQHILYVTNPITKQHFVLPAFHRKIVNYFLTGLGYVASSMEYKVVHTYRSWSADNQWFAMLTLGVDESWRNFEIGHLSVTARGLLHRKPLVTEGFMIWVYFREDILLTLNLETEIFREIPVPQGLGEGLFKYYFATGRYLSVITICSEFRWGVWEMNPEDPVEWRRLADIDLAAQKCKLEHLSSNCDCSIEPIGWIKYKEVLLFRFVGSSRICVAYNVFTREIESFELDSDRHEHKYVAHMNSLVWLGGS